MQIKIRKVSILTEFIILGVITSLVVVSLSVWFIVKTCNFYSDKIHQNLKSQGELIEHTFTEAIDHTTYMMEILISQIRNNPNNLPYIRDIMGQFRLNPQVENILTWTSFSWANEKHELLVDTMYGIMKKPITVAGRDYIYLTMKEPGKLHLGDPAFGSTSKTWMIPGGIGVTDRNGKYIGTMTIGFAIDALTNKMKSSLTSEGVDFALFNKDSFLILQSSDNIKVFDEKNKTAKGKIKKHLSKIDFNLPQRQFFKNINLFSSSKNHYIFKMEKYPYAVCLTYDQSLIKQYLWDNLYFRIIEIIGIGSLFLALLVLLYQHIVKPMVNLSKAANQISKKEHIKKIPRGHTYETVNLALQLLKVKRSIFQERLSKDKLTQAIQVAENSDRMREDFIKKVRNETQEPLKLIINLIEYFISIAEDKKTTVIDFSHHLKLLKTIHQSALHVQSMTNDVLNLTEVNVSEIIKQSITILSRSAFSKNIRLCNETSENIPLLRADELKLKQVFVGLINRALEFSPSNSTIKINLYTQFNNQILWTIVEITDESFGLSESDRKRISGLQNQEYATTSLDGTNLIMSTLESLVHMHSGYIILQDIHGFGSKVTVGIPYLNKKQNSSSENNNKEKHNIVTLFKK